MTVLESRSPGDFLLFYTLNILRSFFLTIKRKENKELVSVLLGLPPPLGKGVFGPLVCVSVEVFTSGTPLPPPPGQRLQLFPAELKCSLRILLNTMLRAVPTPQNTTSVPVYACPLALFSVPRCVLTPRSKRTVLGRGAATIYPPSGPSGEEKAQQWHLGWTLLSGNTMPVPLAASSLLTSFPSKTAYFQFKEPPRTGPFRPRRRMLST